MQRKNKNKKPRERGEYRSKWHMVHTDPKVYTRQKNKQELLAAINDTEDSV